MRFIYFFRLTLLISVYYFAGTTRASAQCATPISTFPYNESFEASDGGWTTGGTASDWVWGTPTKPVISGAAGGAKCWITGGLTGSSYNNGENAWLQSPCFDFTTLVNPRIAFMLFWETEKKYDGALMEYSTTNGTSWSLLGSINDNICVATNWYNNAAVNFLGSSNGWSGNIQSTSGSCQGGNGSNGWVAARHDLTFLAGMSSVIFRFRFGAGTTCNNFDGFAIDDIIIEETPPRTGDFTYTCNNNRDVSFTSTTSPCASTYAWDFGDPASVPNNTSAVPNPTHTFSSAGTYTVTLTITYFSGPPVRVSYTFEILDVNISQLVPIFCNGDQTAAIVAIVNGGSGSYNYTWNTTPPQTTFDLSNIGAGTYTVDVTSATACATSATYVVTEPAPINIIPNITDAACNNNNGSISTTVTGGTTPYLYLWSNGGLGSSISNLSPGTYFLNLFDANGCTALADNMIVNNIDMTVNVSLGADIVACPGMSIVLKPGPYSSYRWQDNSTNSTFNVTSAGKYWVTVTNSVGCSGSDTVNVNLDCADVYFPGAITPNGDTRNDLFGPMGTMVSLIRNYTLRVYDRYGQIVFYSTDPYARWDGTAKGKPYNSGAFTWFATYNILGKAPDIQNGTILLLR